MENTVTIRSLLGITQLEMAGLLGISRSHWSMIESGRRNMPQGATIIISQMIARVQNAKSVESPSGTTPHAQRETYLKRLLDDKDYQSMMVERKIKTLQKKLNAQTSREHLRKSLDTKHAEDKAKTHVQVSPARMPKSMKHGIQTLLFQFEVKRKLLEAEKKCLEFELAAVLRNKV